MTVTCPDCGCQFEPDHKIIHLRETLHFSIDMNLLRTAFKQAWRDSGAVRVTTRQVATTAGISEGHCRRGLRILAAAGEILKIGEKSGWKIVDRFDRSIA